jgi:hypothetical protein
MNERIFGRDAARAGSVGTWVRRAAAGAALLLLAACATAPGPGSAGAAGLTKDSPVEVKRAALTKRVEAKWAALIKEDRDTAYLFLSPAAREVTTLETFKAGHGGTGFRKIEIKSIECEPETCRVQLMLTYDHQRMTGIVTPLSETWVLDNGQFWYVWR